MYSLSKTEQVAFQLIKSDLQFINTIYQNTSKTSYSYPVVLLPNIGLIIEGCEGWSNKVCTLKKNALKFSDEEKLFYSELRNWIKLWETTFADLYVLLKEKYDESEKHFSNCCKPIAKKLKLYDVFGAYLVDGMYCDNTILDMLFIPRFEFDHINGQYIKNMSTFIGRIIALFGITKEDTWGVNHSLTFENKDYGGFVKSPVGNFFNSKFVLFSVLCAINFILFGVDKFIVPEIPTKLRLAYIQYYYLLKQLPQINSQLNTQFYMNNQWVDPQGVFRNCMAHYGIGVALSQEEVIETDLFGGLTQKIFGEDWVVVKNSIIDELSQLSKQVRTYLELK